MIEMSENEYSFEILPWIRPTTLRNFVPEHTRYFTHKKCGVFIGWREELALIFTLQSNIESLKTQKPLGCQVLSSRGKVLDVVQFGTRIYFITPTGLFQVLCSKDHLPSKEILVHLQDCKTYVLVDAFELSSLKKLLAVAVVPDDTNKSENHFAAVTCMKDTSEIDVELYSVSGLDKECQLRQVVNISKDCFSKDERGKCACSFLTNGQAKELFSDIKDAEILIVGLESGLLYCVPFLLTQRNYGIRPTPRLIYQSSWPIMGLMCPIDGCNLFLVLHGGTVLNISSQPKSSKKASLCYHSFSLSYSPKCFSALKNNVIVLSDGLTTNIVNFPSMKQFDIHSTSLGGVTAISNVPNSALIIASTLHNVSYLLNTSTSQQTTESASSTWTGGSLDMSLQIVEEMKKQTQLLSWLREEIKQEDCIIRALSAVARGRIFANCFTISAVVMGFHKGHESEFPEENCGNTNSIANTQPSFQLSVEIKNFSPEEFTQSLWQVCLEISNPLGTNFSRNICLSKTLSQKSSFSTNLTVPYDIKKLSFPIQVKAGLVAQLKEESHISQWLKIPVGIFKLDISHFFSVLSHPPSKCERTVDTVAEYIQQLHLNYPEIDVQSEELKKKSALVFYVIPIAEQFRKPNIILEKLLSKCQHHNKGINLDFYHQSDKTEIWLTVAGKAVRLNFRKSCASISISSMHVDMLHSIKICLANMFSAHKSGITDSSSLVPPVKAKTLHAILETQSIDESLDSKELLIIHQDLRNSVSSQIV